MFQVFIASLIVVVSCFPDVAAAQTRTEVLPVLGSAPETGAQFGVALFGTRRSDDSLGTRPTSLIGNAILSSKGQQRAFVEYDRWSPGNERRRGIVAAVSRFPLSYHGVGDRTGTESVLIEPTTLEFFISGQKKIRPATWRSASLRLSHTDVDPLTDPLDPAIRAAFSYRMVTGTIGIVHDTRDGLFAPTRGKVVDVSLGVSPLWSDAATSAITRLRVDARGYRSLTGVGVLAVQALLQGNDGDVPVDQMVLVGNPSLNRGYTMGRYRDNWMAASQLELRSRGIGRRGGIVLAAFAGAAVIGEDLSALPSARILPSGGGGIRFLLDPRTRSSIRVDYGIGASGQSGLYLAFNEAF